MNQALALLSILALALASSVFAEDKAQVAPVKKDCPLCKLPNRAALFAGTVEKCPAGCAKLCCTGTEVTYVVEGMSCDRCSTKVKTTLTQLAGVEIVSLSHDSGLAALRYDPSKVTPAKLIATISTAGYKVIAEQASFRVPAMKDDPAAEAIEAVLGSDQGVLRIVTVCSSSSRAVVTFDPAKTSKEKLAAAINSTKFKVADR